ncbi:shikimate dehydrogenase family protein [Pantoea sp. App145]|uniref:shikimate dehydrogenase family protein n=1 Tax=Pantoea sp. App145 TaxID=3071567 RepID=UPI003A8052A0
MLEQVDGRLVVLGILGDPVHQVKAPLMMNAEIRRNQLAETLMIPFHVSREGLNEFLTGLKSWQNFRGTIVTMPHKQAVMASLDQVSEQAKAIGACNVIRRETDGSLTGTMLDGEGFVSSLLAAGYKVTGKSIYLAGAGGAASAIAHALASHGIAGITIYNRTQAKAEELRQALHKQYHELQVYIGTDTPEPHDIAINATSAGMGNSELLPFSLEKLTQPTLICDIIIYPERTLLLQQAEKQGLPTHYGRAMLQQQISLMLKYMLHQ